MALNGEKPVPYDLSDWADGREIFFCCPKCAQSFKLFGRNERYCHSCGQKIDWTNVPEKCTEEQVRRLRVDYDIITDDGNWDLYRQLKAEIMDEIYQSSMLNKQENTSQGAVKQ